MTLGGARERDAMSRSSGGPLDHAGRATFGKLKDAARALAAVRACEVLCAPGVVGMVVLTNLRFMRSGGAMLQHWDESYSLAFARRMLDGRNLPYVDGCSQRGPLFYWILALGVKLGGVGTFMPVRVIMLLAMSLTVTFGFLAAYVARRSLAGAIMAVGYFTLCTWAYGEGPVGFGFACNSEHFANTFGMAALFTLAFTLRDRRGRPSLVGLALAGVLVMLSALCKQVGIVIAL